jgi:hypothetical protein
VALYTVTICISLPGRKKFSENKKFFKFEVKSPTMVTRLGEHFGDKFADALLGKVG